MKKFRHDHPHKDTKFRRIIKFFEPALIALAIMGLYIAPSVWYEITTATEEKEISVSVSENGYRIQGKYELQYGDIPYDDYHDIVVVSESYDGRYLIEAEPLNDDYIRYEIDAVLFGAGNLTKVGVDGKAIDVNTSTGFCRFSVTLPADHTLKQVIIS